MTRRRAIRIRNPNRVAADLRQTQWRRMLAPDDHYYTVLVWGKQTVSFYDVDFARNHVLRERFCKPVIRLWVKRA